MASKHHVEDEEGNIRFQASDATDNHDAPGMFDKQPDEDEDGMDGKGEVEDRLYAILNLPKDAGASDIRDRYRELAVIFHPDKAPPSHRTAAESQFRELQRAYEVLSDPQKRAAYDALGEQGLRDLETLGWTVGERYKSFEEMKKEYAELTASRAAARANGLFRCVTSNATVSLDVSRRTPVGVHTRTALSSTYKTELNGRTQATVNVSLGMARQFHPGAGQVLLVPNGRVMGALRYQASPRLRLRLMAAAPMLSSRALTTEAVYRVDGLTTTEIQLSSPIPSLSLSSLKPLLSWTVRRSLGPASEGTIALSNFNPFLSVSPVLVLGYTTIPTSSSSTTPSLLATETHSSETQLVLGAGGAVAVMSYSVPLGKYLSVDVGRTVSLLGGEGMGGGGEVWVKTSARVVKGLGVEVGMALGGGAKGWTCQVSIIRPGTRFSVPIVLAHPGASDEWSWLDPVTALALSFVPSALAWVLEERVWAPRRRKDRLQRRKSGGVGDEAARARAQALEVTELMRGQVEKKVDAERMVDGLIITRATYGGSADVRVALQSMVRASQLGIPGGRSKRGLVGFYLDEDVGGDGDGDEGDGEVKLEVEYTFRGKMHRVVVDDRAPLLIPMRSHIILPDI